MSKAKIPKPGAAHFGIAVDMGTTLVCAGVVDLNDGKEIAVSSQPNGQLNFGDNIISRINFVLRHSQGLKKLNRALIITINRVITDALESAGVKEKDVLRLTAVGNTAMHHILLSIMPVSLITPPYSSAAGEAREVKTKSLGIFPDNDTPLRILPNLGGFVGSDCLGMILSAGIFRSRRIKLAVDLGTNGNIVLGSKERILVTSTAAGGAFEGRHISCGMRAKEGAIENVWLKRGKVRLRIIGKSKTRGICGSGLIDVVAEMLKARMIDKKGKMKTSDFVLHRDNSCAIKITAQDVREIQLAKAGIGAGIKILQKELGVKRSDINEVFLSGAFGNRIRKESVLGIGLMPQTDRSRVRFIGNGALKGAEMAVISEENYSRALAVTKKIEHIPLGEREDFIDQFAHAMRF